MKQIDLLNGSIPGSLSRLAFPIMGTSLIQMAYNLTDMVWIGRVSADAVAAVGAAGMYMWLANAIAIIPRLGGQVNAAHALGSGNPRSAALCATGALHFSFALGVLCGIGFFLFASPLIAFFRLNQAGVIADAESYLRIVSAGLLFTMFNQALTGLFAALGMSGVTFRCTAVGLVGNIVLDPLLIFGFAFLPPLGAAGAAIATVLAQGIVFVLFLISALREETLFRQVRLLHPAPLSVYREIVRIGFFPALQNAIFSSISMLLARFVAGYGDAAVAVQKVGGQIESISWMTADGFATATNVFIAQNAGAGRHTRVRRGYLTALSLMAGWGVLTSLILIALPAPIFRIFIPDVAVVPMGVDYLRILGYSQLFMCLEITAAGAFQGLGRPLVPSVCGILGNAARIPATLFLSSTALALNGIWWSISLTSIAKGLIVSVWFAFVLRRYMRRVKLGV